MLSSRLPKNRIVRNIEAGEHFEIFFVAAITAILSIRLFLVLTGYPQIGNSDLHIAHMLWGGLLMVVAIIVLIAFVGQVALRFAVVIGGAGFGVFIDEIGKFVTKDNNYFFEPAIALIYMNFIFIVLVVRAIGLRGHYSAREYLVNSLKKAEEIALRNLDAEEKRRALNYLSQCDPSEPLVQAIGSALSKSDLVSTPTPGILWRAKALVTGIYASLIRLPGFNLILVMFFSFQLLVKFAYVFVLLFLKGLSFDNLTRVRMLASISENVDRFNIIDWAQLLSSFVSAFFVFWGILALRRSRLRAFEMFERSVLVTIFITQVFMFYQNQFSALSGLFFNLFVLYLLRYMINRES